MQVILRKCRLSLDVFLLCSLQEQADSLAEQAHHMERESVRLRNESRELQQASGSGRALAAAQAEILDKVGYAGRARLHFMLCNARYEMDAMWLGLRVRRIAWSSKCVTCMTGREVSRLAQSGSGFLIRGTPLTSLAFFTRSPTRTGQRQRPCSGAVPRRSNCRRRRWASPRRCNTKERSRTASRSLHAPRQR